MRHSIERRRPLSVLVCDLVGSTRYVDRLDPEDVNEAFAVFRQICVEAIRRYGGYAESVQGDAVRGLFGYPRALEIAAVRASQAALDIVAELESTPIESLRAAFPDGEQHAHLRVRAGIATSTALVGGLTEYATEVPVSGRAPWLAARLGDLQKSLGEVNAVLITDETRERCGNFFDIEDAGQHALRGFDEPVRAWRVLGVAPHDSLAEVRTRRPSGPLVGRVTDLERLHGAWAAARRGAGQAVFIGGDAGIGKSRLLKALTDDVDRSMPKQYYRVRYQCYPYHATTSLYPFIRQLNKVASMRGASDPEGRLDGLERGLVTPNRHREEVLRLSADLLALPCDDRYAALDLSPPQRKERTRWMLVEQLCWLAQRQPVLVVLEDAHWADPSTIEIIDHVLRRIRSERVLVVISHRPEFEPHIAALTAENYERIALEPLAEGESRALVGSIDAAGRLAAEAVEQVVQRSAGNPFFLEELSALLLRDAAATGRASPARGSVPGTLEDSLMARIDQLADQRHALHCASVIGQEFARPLLELAAGGDAAADIETLLDAGIFQQRGGVDEDLLAFRHALLQEQVYQSLPRAERQQLHTTIRDTLEVEFPQQVLAVPELLAYHSQHGGDPARALGYWQQAIGRSMSRHACEEALAHAESALALVETLPPSVERDKVELKVHIVTGAALQALHGFASGGAMRSFQRANQLASQVGSAEDQANVRRGMYACLYVRSQHRQTLGMAQALLNGAGEEPTAVAMAHYMLGLSHFWLDEFEQSNLRLGACDTLMTDEVIGRIRASWQTDPVTMVALHNAWLQWMLGENGTAWTLAEQAVEAGREHSPLSFAMALFVYNALYANDHNGRAHPGRLRELKDIAREHHLAHPAAAAVFLEGHDLIYRGEHEAGIAKVSEGMALFDRQEAGLGKPWGQSFAVHALLALDRAGEALEILDSAARLIEECGEFMWKAEVQRLRARVRRALGENGWQEDLYAAFATARAQGAARLALRAAIDLAELAEHGAGATDSAAAVEAMETLRDALGQVDRWPSADRARAEQILEGGR